MPWPGSNFIRATNLPMSGYKHTGVADATANDEYATLGQIQTGGVIRAVETLTSTSASLDDTHYTVLIDDDTAGGAVTINLPAAASHSGREYRVKKLGTTANVTIDPNGSETIDGATTKILTTQYDAVTIQCDGTEWWIL